MAKESEKMKLLSLSDNIKERVIGQFRMFVSWSDNCGFDEFAKVDV